ncbi:hypothetical protein GCM10009813_34120 [Brevibacterium marinum]
MEPGLGAVIFLTLTIIVVFSVGAFLVYRVMNRPGMHIGSRLPDEDPTGEDDSDVDPTGEGPTGKDDSGDDADPTSDPPRDP